MNIYTRKIYLLRKFGITVVIAALVSLFISSVCSAGVVWTANGVELRKPGVNDAALNPQITADGSGGAIVTWQDTRSGVQYDIYAQRIDSMGEVKWAAIGVELRGTGVSNSAQYPQITADGSGGAIVTWQDRRSGQWDIYAQKIDSTGAVQWTANGVELRGTGVSENADNPQITADGSGGAVVTWRDYRSGQWDIFAQRIDSTGAVQWAANGMELRGTGVSDNAERPQITVDGSGGAIVTWMDHRSGQWDIYAQRIDSTGAVQWAANGVELRGAGVSYDAYNPQITADGSGGAIVTWRDYRSGQWDIYTQRIDSTGAVQWTINGVELRGTGVSDNADKPQITVDGSGGAIVTWMDYRSGSQSDIYARRIDSSGVAQWKENGVELRGAGVSNDARHPQITEDGSGGAVVTWQDLRSGSQWEIYAQGIDSTSAVQWTADGVELRGTGVSYDAYNPQITEDGLGGAIVTWEDDRSGLRNTYAQRVLCPSTPTLTGITPGSGEFGTTVSVTDLSGTGFYGTPDVKLKKSGAADIDASGVAVISSTQITCSFDLPWDSTLGDWDVYVENPNGQNYTLSNGFTVNAPAPTVTGVTPQSGNRGTTVSVADLSGTNFFGTPTVKLKKTGETDIDASDVSVESPTQITCSFDLPEDASLGDWDVYVENPDGQNDTLKNAFSVTNEIWYLAEGTTAWGFDTYITIENPTGEEEKAEITYNTEEGSVSGGRVTLPPMSQTTVNPGETLGEKDFSTEVELLEGKRIAVDRTMSWTGEGAASPEGHCSIGVTSQAKTWYLPEGSSAWGFECWLLIQNPSDQSATAQVTYMLEGAGPVTSEKAIPPNSRRSYNMADDIGAHNASIKVNSDIPVVTERAMYRNSRREGHESIGAITPADDYYLAEGAVGYESGFTTYVLVQNPNNEPTDVGITFLTGSGEVEGPAFSMEPNSRKTVRANDYLPPDSDVSTHVHGSRQIIAERAMYWNTPTGEVCHDSIGMAGAHKTFYMPDGQTSQGRETWTLVSNPNGSDVKVRISYLSSTDEGTVTFEEIIPANSRKSFNMKDRGVTGRAAVLVESITEGKKIMCERSMYWNSRGAGTNTIGGYSD